MTPAERTDLVQELARRAGLARVGVARAQPAARIDFFDDWLARGFAGEMIYLARHRELRADPGKLLPGARCVIVVADNYRQKHPPPDRPDHPPTGRVARYAWGRDYHRVLTKKLQKLTDRLHEAIEEPFGTRVCVDTAPVFERQVAVAGGIGWQGKNTMVINRELGSFFFLGEIVTTLELEPTPAVADRCGTCTRCLDACPTGALIEPYRMNASRCIAYLTIEHRSQIPADLQPMMGNRVFGCDVCQDVCPYNRKTPPTSETEYEVNERWPLSAHPPLVELINLTEEQYKQQLTGSAMKRATRDMLQRNADIALRNQALSNAWSDAPE